jgi:hypothetical protein
MADTPTIDDLLDAQYGTQPWSAPDKFNADSNGVAIGALAESLAAQKPTAEYANGVVAALRQLSTFVQGTAAITALQIATSLRIPTYTTAGRPAAGTAGRVIFDTDLSSMFVDDGAAYVAVGGGGAPTYPQFTMSMSTNAARFLPWGSESSENSTISFGNLYITPFACTITGFVVRASGSTIPGVSTFQVTDDLAAPIGAAFDVDIDAQDTVYTTDPLSVAVAAQTAIGVQFDPATSPGGEVIGHMVVEPQ